MSAGVATTGSDKDGNKWEQGQQQAGTKVAMGGSNGQSKMSGHKHRDREVSGEVRMMMGR